MYLGAVLPPALSVPGPTGHYVESKENGGREAGGPGRGHGRRAVLGRRPSAVLAARQPRGGSRPGAPLSAREVRRCSSGVPGSAVRSVVTIRTTQALALPDAQIALAYTQPSWSTTQRRLCTHRKYETASPLSPLQPQPDYNNVPHTKSAGWVRTRSRRRDRPPCELAPDRTPVQRTCSSRFRPNTCPRRYRCSRWQQKAPPN